MTALAVLMVIPSALMAQSYGSINIYSPYSMYGVGELSTQGTLVSRSMGGVGVALRSYSDVNLLNPASHSVTANRSVLFSYGMNGSNYFNTQMQGDSQVSNSYASFNINDISVQIPLGKKIGMGISVTPYSSVGYDISTSENFTDIGLLSYIYEGGGDITLVKMGVGWEVMPNLSVGLAAQYYWGQITRGFTMIPYNVTGYGSYYSTVGETEYTFSRIRAQAGLQWLAISSSTKALIFGATYDLGGDLKPRYDHNVYGDASLYTIVAESISEELSLVLPSQLAAGVSYQNLKWLFAADYVYQDWYSQNSDLDNTINTSSGVEIAYNDFSTYKFGVQYTPNRNDVRRYFRRVSYRGGFRFGGYQQTFSGEDINQFAVTAGLSFPLKMNGVSKIDAGFEYGSRGSSDTMINVDSDTQVGLIRQDYFKFSIGFTLFGEDYWFQRPKFD